MARDSSRNIARGVKLSPTAKPRSQKCDNRNNASTIKPKSCRLIAAPTHRRTTRKSPGLKQAAGQVANHSAAARVAFRVTQQRHPDIKTTIGGLDFGNSQKCYCDVGELDLERELALGT